jgi:hypothetical protein
MRPGLIVRATTTSRLTTSRLSTASPAQRPAGHDDPLSQGITTIFLPGEETCACHACAASSSE